MDLHDSRKPQKLVGDWQEGGELLPYCLRYVSCSMRGVRKERTPGGTGLKRAEPRSEQVLADALGASGDRDRKGDCSLSLLWTPSWERRLPELSFREVKSALERRKG